ARCDHPGAAAQPLRCAADDHRPIHIASARVGRRRGAPAHRSGVCARVRRGDLRGDRGGEGDRVGAGAANHVRARLGRGARCGRVSPAGAAADPQGARPPARHGRGTRGVGRDAGRGGTVSPIVMVICGVLLTAAALTTLVRAERGPSTLDRIVSIDGLVAVVIAMLTIYSAWTGRQDLVVILVVLASVGFVGSVTLARFAAADPPSAEESDAARAELVRERLARVRARMEAEQEAAHRRAGPEGTAEE